MDWWDELLATGYGSQFSYIFHEGEPFEGDTYVRFYCDDNLNGRWDVGEARLDSEEFWVQQKKVYNLSVRYSTLLGVITTADVQAVLNSNADLALKKDSAPDYRACVALNVASLSPFTPSPEAPDPCYNDAERDELLNDGYYLTIVNELDKPMYDILGWANWHPFLYKENMAVDWPRKVKNTVIHELGHNRTLDDVDDLPRIMFGSPAYVDPAGRECTRYEAGKYDQ